MKDSNKKYKKRLSSVESLNKSKECLKWSYFLRMPLECLWISLTVRLVYIFIFRREISSWKCAQDCFNRANDNFAEANSFRRKRSLDNSDAINQIEGLELQSQIAHSLMDYCSKRQVFNVGENIIMWEFLVWPNSHVWKRVRRAMSRGSCWNWAGMSRFWHVPTSPVSF